MMDEHFMRGWTHGHERLSADIDRGLKWLRAKAGQFVELVTPSHLPSEDVYFVSPIPARRTRVRAIPVRAAKRR